MSSASRFSFDPAEFAGKRILVTGGTKGMGEAIVRRLVASGARVATTARSPLPEGQTVELFVQADISTRHGIGGRAGTAPFRWPRHSRQQCWRLQRAKWRRARAHRR
jgi:NAD(P)-dependent dehydrogenase (short-subunit alcohol dehydrogenase family)